MNLHSRALFALLFLATLATKVVLALTLPLFGDEAFYWLESRHLAPGYSDVPPATSWLIALGNALGGATPIGVRWPFLLLGASVPLLVFTWARRFVGDGEARAAGTLSMCLPLAATLGVFALPDVPLTVATLLAALALDAAWRTNRRRDHLLFGLALAGGWLCHYRFAMVYVAGLVVVFGVARGTALLRNPRFWLAQALGLVGLLPLLLFNLDHDWAALRFQFVERHPWSFHAGALLEPLVQALVTTPILFVAILVAVLLALRRGDDERPWPLLGAVSGGLLLGYFAIGLFADVERVRFHWELPAYLLALPLVPQVLRGWRDAGGVARLGSALAVPLAVAGVLVAASVLALAARPARNGWLPAGRPIPENLQGWRETGRYARSWSRRMPGATLIADNFMLGAELEFELKGRRPVYVLEHPRNAKHGRAVQLKVWARDETGLGATDWNEGLLFVEEQSRRPVDRLEGYRSLCRRFGSVRLLDELSLFDGYWRIVAFAVTPRGDAPSAEPCQLPAFAYIDTPPPDAWIGAETAAVNGWAIAEHVGVDRVELLVDGRVNGDATYGMPAPQVLAQWPQSQDPNHPRVGFAGMIALDALAPGVHELALRVTDREGRQRVLAVQRFRKGVPY